MTQSLTLAMGSTADGWFSSEAYYNGLYQELKARQLPFQLQRWHSEDHSHPLWRRRVVYPRQLKRNVSGFLHLVDQSYADALLSYSAPALLTVHDIYFWHQRGGNPLRKMLRSRIVEGIRKARHLLAMGQFTKDELVKYLAIDPQKISVVHNAIDNAWLGPIPPMPQELKARLPAHFILHVGSLIERKGMHKFLKAYALNKDFPPLLQVGGVPDRGMNEIILKLGLKERVFFLGVLDLHNIRALMGQAAAFVFPSRFEGFGLPAAEAWASGTPLLCTSIPSVNELLPIKANIQYGDTIEDWACALESLLRAQRPVRPTPSELYRVSWKRHADQVLEVYRNSLFS